MQAERLPCVYGFVTYCGGHKGHTQGEEDVQVVRGGACGFLSWFNLGVIVPWYGGALCLFSRG